MGRGSREKKKLIAEINITPFTDVILVLLVIFMITTPLIYQTSIEVKLPEVGSNKPGVKNTNRLDITVTESGAIYFGKDLIAEKALKEKAAKVRKNNPDIVVFLKADKSVKFKYIVRILDILIDGGLSNLNIAAIADQQ